MSKRASNFQKRVMSLGYRGKEIFKPSSIEHILITHQDTDQVCNSMKKQKPHNPSAPYDGYDEREDTEDKARRTRWRRLLPWRGGFLTRRLSSCPTIS